MAILALKLFFFMGIPGLIIFGIIFAIGSFLNSVEKFQENNSNSDKDK